MRKTFQFLLLYIKAYFSRFKTLLFFGLLGGFIFTLLFVTLYPSVANLLFVKYLRIAIVGNYNEFNLPLNIQNQISFGLTALTPSGEAVPSLAKSWEVDANGLNYMFYLNDNIYWHDGTKFKAKDINFQFKGVTLLPVNDRQIKFILQQPYSPLPVILSRPLFKSNLTGLGTYKVTSIEFYQDTIKSINIKPVSGNLPLIKYKFYTTTQDAILAFKMGEVDELDGISDVGDLKNWNNIIIKERSLYDKFIGVFLNLKHEYFKEKEIRQALNYATPRTEGFEQINSPISKQSWAYTTKTRIYKYDPETALKLLAKSPLSSPSNEITISTYASLINTTQSIIDAWNKIGLHAKMKIVQTLPSDFQVLVIPWNIPADPDQYSYWQSTQENSNITNYNNLKIDKLLEDGRKTFEKEKREKIYIDFQRYLAEDSPVVFLYYPKVYSVKRK